MLGPWSGRLANDSDSVELVKPDAVQEPPHPDAGLVPQVLVDKVRYSALAPWPAGAAAGAHSLQRISLAAYGNDPANWRAAPPTAGRANAGGSDDSDGDGMDDAWELTYFGTLTRDGTGDYDRDGMSDLDEFVAGTNPTLASDVLEFLPMTRGRPGDPPIPGRRRPDLHGRNTVIPWARVGGRSLPTWRSGPSAAP